uniref:G-protein coupled receptors family 1 profile domain-containing protein n=1 Tax=Salarias fasciatus TaxID=181472 RepID=A0A672I517_SALFA
DALIFFLINGGLGYSVVFLLGFLVNAAALWAFIGKRKSWTDTHIYMLNLAIADSLLVIFLPFRIYDSFFCLPKTGLCTFLILLHFTNMYASIGTTTAISVQRYLAVRFPMQARLWKRKKEAAFVVCLVLWVVLLIMCVVFREENYPERLWTCFDRCKDQPLSLKFVLLLVVFGFFIPLLVVVFCSSRIICVLAKADDKTDEKRNIVNIVTANMIVFIICYTPIHVAFLVNFFNHKLEKWECKYIPAHVFLLVSEWIASTNCCFDSISYYFLLKGFFSERT